MARLTLRALITNWRAERVPERRDYLLAHAKDDWINIERSLAVPLADVVAQLREMAVMSGNPTSRDHNKASVLDVVLSRAPLTRNALIEQTGLSKATVSRAVEELRADGFVVNGGVDEVTGRGRRSTYLDVPGTMGHVAGISFGAQTTCVLVSDLRGRELQHSSCPPWSTTRSGTPRSGWTT